MPKLNKQLTVGRRQMPSVSSNSLLAQNSVRKVFGEVVFDKTGLKIGPEKLLFLAGPDS